MRFEIPFQQNIISYQNGLPELAFIVVFDLVDVGKPPPNGFPGLLLASTECNDVEDDDDDVEDDDVVDARPDCDEEVEPSPPKSGGPPLLLLEEA